MKKFEGIRFLQFAHLSVVFTGSHSETFLLKSQLNSKLECDCILLN